MHLSLLLDFVPTLPTVYHDFLVHLFWKLNFLVFYAISVDFWSILINYYYFLMMVIISLYVNEIFKKLVLFLNPKLPRYGRFLIGIQIMIAAILLFITSAFIMLLDEFNEMLINIGALVIINEFVNMMGRIFLMHLTCFHREITK